MPDALVDLALRAASVPAVGLDLARHLTELSESLVRTLGVTAVVVVVLDPPAVHGSDDAAELIGAAQQHASVGPVANAVRSGHPLVVPDLVRVGPPVLAAAAADCGLVSAAVVPLRAGGRAVGALQLLGTLERPVDGTDLDRLGPLPAVLAARLVDVAALAVPPRPASFDSSAPDPFAPDSSAPDSFAPDSSAPTFSVPVVPLPVVPRPVDPSPPTTRLTPVPAPRPRRPAPGPRPAPVPPRHRLSP